MDWIDIKKRLPTEDGNYLVCASSLSKEKPFIQMAWYDPNGLGWSNIPAMWIPSITHWMPVELQKVENKWTAGEDLKKGDKVYFRENGGKVFRVHETSFVLPDDLREAIELVDNDFTRASSMRIFKKYLGKL